MTSLRAGLRLVPFALAAAAMVPSAAAASTIALADNPQTGGKFVDYSAAPGETNEVFALGLVQNRFVVQDGFGAVSITPTQPCTSGIPGENMETRFASCPTDSLEFVSFDLGDGADVGAADMSGLPFPYVMSGGDGSDDLYGGAVDDELHGDAGADYLAGAAGPDLLDGGTGADELLGGDDFDLADYTQKTVPVTATLNGAADDGTAGEGDRIGLDVESIDGGSAGDRLIGDAGANGLFGEAGPDTLDGGAGADRLEGDSGDDTILARDGVADQINCGTGSDSAVIDNNDTVVGCETIARPVTPDALPQLLGSLSIRPRGFRAAPRGPSVVTAVTGARVKYRLSEDAKVRFTVQRARRGVRRGGRCLKRRRSTGGRRCTRYVRLRGSFTHVGKAGKNSFRFRGRMRGRKLRPGRYRLVATPRDAAGNRGKAVRAKFRIVR